MLDSLNLLLFKEEKIHFLRLEHIDIVGNDGDIVKSIFTLVVINEVYLFFEETAYLIELLLIILFDLFC